MFTQTLIKVDTETVTFSLTIYLIDARIKTYDLYRFLIVNIAMVGKPLENNYTVPLIQNLKHVPEKKDLITQI